MPEEYNEELEECPAYMEGDCPVLLADPEDKSLCENFGKRPCPLHEKASTDLDLKNVRE